MKLDRLLMMLALSLLFVLPGCGARGGGDDDDAGDDDDSAGDDDDSAGDDDDSAGDDDDSAGDDDDSAVPAVCGDGVANSDESCDDNDLLGATCNGCPSRKLHRR